ncbi:MAG: glycosyl hydrolase family 28-related protein [Desulfobacterales bacterium]
MKYVLLIFLVFSDGFTQTLWNGQGHIPQSSQVDWTNAGLLPNTPTVASNLVDVTDPEYGAIPNDGQNDFEAIHDAILAARSNPGLTIIYFPPGTYNINSRIDLTYLDNDIVFQGAGSNQTVLKFTVGHTTQCFYIHGYQTSTAVYLSASVSKGSRDLYGNNISSLRAGE